MKLEIIRLIEDWKEDSDCAINRHSVEHEVITTAKVSVEFNVLESGFTDWTSEAHATPYPSLAVDAGLTGLIDRRWCCTCAPSYHAKKSNQKGEVQEENEIVLMPL